MSESSPKDGGLWKSAEFHRGPDLKFPAEVTIPTLTGEKKLWAIIETFEENPARVKYTIPLTQMPIDKMAFSYTRTFNWFSKLNQESIGADKAGLTLPNIMAMLGITERRLKDLKIKPSLKNKDGAVWFELSGRAVTCPEVVMPFLTYAPTERSIMFTERLNRLGWEVTPLDVLELYIQEL